MTNRILIAEDDQINQAILTRQLKRLGYTADIAEDGRAALTLWESQPYDLVISDLHMPQMDGYELCKTIREREAADKLPRAALVMLSANAFGEQQHNMQAAGIDDYLTKPLRLAEIKQVLEKWLVAPEPSALPSLDANALEHILPNSPDAQRATLENYLDLLSDNLKPITQALQHKAFSDLVAASHRLKGASESVGALALAAVCAQIEAAGREQTAADFEALQARLSEQTTQTRKAIRSALDSSSQT